MSISPSPTEAAQAVPPAAGALTMPSRPARPLKRPPTHPGEVLADALESAGISARQCALAIGMTPANLGKVLGGKGPITPETALRLGQYFGNGAELWANMQRDYDLWHSAKALEADLARIKPLNDSAT